MTVCSIAHHIFFKHSSISSDILCRTISFVPKHKPVIESDVNKLRQFIKKYKKIIAVTGAGISTESGIPDYRSEGVGLYARSDKRPVQFQDFLESQRVRTRYWARNFFGWPRFSSFLPNANHYALKDLEASEKLLYIITQNVDGLHYKAGNRKVGTYLHRYFDFFKLNLIWQVSN